MKQITVPKLEPFQNVKFKTIEQALDLQSEFQQIGVLNWKNYPYKPEVKFKIGHTGQTIALKFSVAESYIRAMETRTNGEVYKDSCVEFFISFDGLNYYNFEFNCIGTIHLAYGPGRQNRKHIDPKIVGKIIAKSTLGTKPFDEKNGDFVWELSVLIPVGCFQFDSIQNLTGLEATANFYKCGDATSEPHFVTWNLIGTESPDYHRPEFFGKIRFE